MHTSSRRSRGSRGVPNLGALFPRARGTRAGLLLAYSVGQLILRLLDMSPGQHDPSPRSLTRDDWQRVEAILTRATRLSDAEGKALIDSALLDSPLRREITDLFHLSGPHGLEETRSASVRGSSPASATAAAFRPGDSLEGGRFVIVRQIGRGGMGTVYLAQDTVLGTLVALKIVPPDDRLIQEAQRAAACSGHEHVATVHNVLQSEKGGKRIGVLVLEYVAGRPANRILDDGPVDIGRAIKWVRQAALAVAHAHDSEVLHCDLKPGNMIVTPDDRVKVLDFGIARRSFDPTPAEPRYGTLPYMAPEQLLAGECSRATDVYSLGVTLFQLVTGRLPFTGDDRMIKMQILAAPPPSVSGIVRNAPDGLDAVFERALAKDPAARFQSARAFAQALEDLTRTPAALPASTPPSTISSWLWPSIAALPALLALTLTFGMVACRLFEVFLRIDSEFSASFSDYFRVGREALMPFVTLWGITGVGTAVVAGLVLLVRLLASNAWRRWSDWSNRLNPQALGLSALLLGAAVWGALIWANRDVFDALINLHQHPASAPIAAISFAARQKHLAFSTGCAVLSFFLGLAAVAWLPSLRQRSSNPAAIQKLRWAMLLLALVVMLGPTMPRRFLFERFRVAEYDGRRAVVIGSAGDHVLLYDSARRATLSVRRDAAGLRVTEMTRQVFED